MNKLLALFAACLALGLNACTSTKAASSSSTGTSGTGSSGQGNATGGADNGAGNNTAGGANAGEPVVPQPEINTKAKLAFEDANKAYSEALKKGGKLDYPALEQKYQAAAAADEKLAEPSYDLGVLAEKQGKTREAVGFYKAALARKPSLRQAAENLAVIAQNSGDEAGAIGIYQDIVAKYPEDASSRARLAEITRRKGDCPGAITMAKEALFRDPHTAQAYKVLMLCAYEQKQYSMARLVALRASKIDENDPEIFYTMGQINLQEKDPAKARVQFKKAVEARPDFLPAHLQLAKMAMETEDYKSAEESIRRILQANGNNPEALLNLGVAYKGMGEYDKATAAYDAAQKIKPDMPEIYLARGFIFGVKAQPEKALELYKTYLQMKGGDSAVAANHPVREAMKDQEAVIAHREEDKKAAEEAAKMEAEAKKAEDEAAALEKKTKEEEFKKTQADAKGNAAKDAAKGADTGEQMPEGKDPKPGVKGGKPDPKADLRGGTKPDAKVDPKADAKPDAKVEAKADSKSEARPAEDPKKGGKKAEPAKPASAPAPAAKPAGKGEEPSDAL